MASLSPYESIRAQYALHAGPDDMTWEELVGWHLANPLAYVIKEPRFFVLCRGVIHGAPVEDVHNLTLIFPAHLCNAWYLYAFAGDMKEAVAVLTDKLHAYPWIGWDRFGETEKSLRWHQCSRIRQKLT